ncbi:RNA polymerase sigma factor [Chondrinema litorale]|uniref:RNA polymerase sigma factor n=1 Tax=Chondrinema litorale TaxID=2994555 RepID=UPI002543824D|nr:RNA polymerase sigma factor [Chondrinema litorale]UZR96108.1 RNA polymerase sigma factor [Chondrinema litorale]
MRLFKNYKKKSDEQLMQLVQQGDSQAFSIIYDRYAHRIKAFFYRMLWADDAKAEDYVHDLFARIIERPELYQSGYPLLPWLFRIASNMCKNAYRKRQFEVEYLQQIEKNKMQLSAVEQKMDEEILLDKLHQVLKKLGEDKQELFLLRYQQQLSTKELASIYVTSEGTIKSRLFYIRKTLLDVMGEDKIIWENGK